MAFLFVLGFIRTIYLPEDKYAVNVEEVLVAITSIESPAQMIIDTLNNMNEMKDSLLSEINGEEQTFENLKFNKKIEYVLNYIVTVIRIIVQIASIPFIMILEVVNLIIYLFGW